jgi:undecaprenyl-diphosphatase
MGNLNIALFDKINGLAATHFDLNNFMIFVAKYGVFIIPIILIFLLIRKDYKDFLFVGSSVALALLIGYITKDLFYHPRPFAMGVGYDLVKDGNTSSFPSNHTVAMFALATALFLIDKRLIGAISLVFAVLVGVSRVYIGVHFPLDILGGIVYGVALTLLFYLIFPKMYKKFAKRYNLKGA